MSRKENEPEERQNSDSPVTRPTARNNQLSGSPVTRRTTLKALTGTGIVGLASIPTSADDGKEGYRPGGYYPSNRVTFLTTKEINAIRARIKAGQEPWASAYDQFQTNIDKAMTAQPRSVVDNGAPAGADEDNPRLFGTDAPYQHSDGVRDPNANHEDAEAARDMATWIRDTALAYVLTGEDAYAERAIDLLHHWCLDSETGMVPTTKNHSPHTEGFKGQWSIALYTKIPAMFYGASLIAGHPYWEEYGGLEKLDEWARAFLQSTEERGVASGSNGTSWRALTWITMAAYLDDEDALRRGYRFWSRGFVDMNEKGLLEHELIRANSLRYSVFALTAMTEAAEVARRWGDDLYGYSAEHVDGSAIRTIADTLAPYVLDPSDWEYDQMGWKNWQENKAAGVYELLYSRWEEETYLDVIEKAGRPVTASSILGDVTLTHGNTFDLGPKIKSDTSELPAEYDASITREWVEPGGSTSVTASIYNPSSIELEDVAFTVDAENNEIEWTAESEIVFDAVSEEESRTAEWEVTFPEEEDEYRITVDVTYVKDGESRSLSDTLSCAVSVGNPRQTMTTDFSEYEIGTTPADWGLQWSSGDDAWEVVEKEDGSGGQMLKFESDTGRHALSWNDIPDDTRDVEVLAKVHVPEVVNRGNHARLHLRSGTTDDGNGRGYYFDLREEGFSIWSYDPMYEIGRVGTPKSDTWYWIRFRAVGQDLKLRYWEVGDEEPVLWHIEETDTTHITGWVGAGSFNPETSHWDVFSVGTGGETAPMPGDTET